jgi:hypothetical protein
MASLIFFTCFKNDFADEIHDFENHTFKLALTAGEYDPEEEEYKPLSLDKTNWNSTDFPELFGSLSYPSGGYTLEKKDYVESNGSHSLFFESLNLECPNGQFFGPFRYLIVYNPSAGDRLIGYFDYTAVKDLNAGETFYVGFADEIDPAIKVTLITNGFVLFKASRMSEHSGNGLLSTDPLTIIIHGSDELESMTFNATVGGTLTYSRSITGTGSETASGLISVRGVALTSSSGSLSVSAGDSILLTFRGKETTIFNAQMYITASA